MAHKTVDQETVTMGAEDALWKMDASVLGRRWRLRGEDSDTALADTATIAEAHAMPQVLARALAGRGMAGAGDLEQFMRPRLKDLCPDPSTLADMDRAVALCRQVIVDGGCVGVLSDYDVDGATSAAQMVRFFRALGVAHCVHIPDRVTEGYGPGEIGLQRLQEQGAQIVLCLDCGTASGALLQQFQTRSSTPVVVLDHHSPDGAAVSVGAFVNPNRQDDHSGQGHLAACGVVFLFLVALHRSLRTAPSVRAHLPELMTFLDLVALGTIADMVPMLGLNRALVHRGLEVLAQSPHPGVQALLEVAGLSAAPTAEDISFQLAPRLNAAGRMGDASRALRLLVSADADEAYALARDLDQTNARRKRAEATCYQEALAQAETCEDGLIHCVGTTWPEGIIGIIAGRLTERLRKPTMVSVQVQEGMFKGSARSTPGFDMGAALLAAHREGLLERGGGHAMAGGYSFRSAHLEGLNAFMAAQWAAQRASEASMPVEHFDGFLTPGGVNVALGRALQRLAPFGVGNPAMRFVMTGVEAAHIEAMGEGHMRMLWRGSGSVRGVAFRALEGPLGGALLRSSVRRWHVLGQVISRSWQGREQVQFRVEDLAPAEA